MTASLLSSYLSPIKHDVGDVWGVLKVHFHVELGQAKIYT